VRRVVNRSERVAFCVVCVVVELLVKRFKAVWLSMCGVIVLVSSVRVAG